jgi:hypothetical protein
MLVLATFKCHLTLDIKSVIHAVSCALVVIPAGMTSELPVLVNNPFNNQSFETTVFQMALGKGPCSDTTVTIKKSCVELLCQWIKTMEMGLSRSGSQRI